MRIAARHAKARPRSEAGNLENLRSKVIGAHGVVLNRAEFATRALRPPDDQR
jgi:hypothetical protein